MTLWEMIMLWSLGMTLGGAIAAARVAKADVGEFALAMVSGLAVGLLWTWALRRVSERVFRAVDRHPATAQGRYLRALYLAAMVWAALGLIPGMWVATRAIRVIR